MNDLITVIINVYNGEKFIDKCVKSVINQTYKNLEILIVNDGSTDNTLKLCKKIKDKRIRIITTDNMGLGMSRNVGIDNAKGEYLYFVDVDDFIEEDTIEYLYNLCIKYNSKFSTCYPLTIFDYNFNKKDIKEKISILDSKEMVSKILLSDNGATAMWNKLLKKDLFDNIRFEPRITNDITVTYKIALKTNNIIYSNQYKYYYLKHKDAITVNKKYETLEKTKDRYKAIVDRYYDVKKIYNNYIENDIALLRGIQQLYLYDNDQSKKFLKDNKTYELCKKIFSFKILFAKVRMKEKLKIILFMINPNLFIKFGNTYRKKYKYN